MSIRTHWNPEHVRDQIHLNGVHFGWITAYSGAVHRDSLELRHPYAPHAYWHLMKGSVAVKCRSVWHEASAGQVMLLPEGAREHIFATGSELVSIRFELKMSPSQPSIIPQIGKPLVLNHADVCEEWMRLSQELASPAQQSDSGNLDRFQKYLSWLEGWSSLLQAHPTVQIKQSEPVRHPKVAAALNWLNTMDLALHFTEETLAKKFNLSKNYLRRLFREQGLVSPTRILDQRKEDEAILRLTSTQQGLQQIADELGFASASHFAYWFKRRRGLPPSKLRERACQTTSHWV